MVHGVCVGVASAQRVDRKECTLSGVGEKESCFLVVQCCHGPALDIYGSPQLMPT